MSKTEELKTVAQIRKAIMPLVEIMKADVNKEITSRLDVIEGTLTELAKKEFEARGVNITMETPEAITQAIDKMSTIVMQKNTTPVPVTVTSPDSTQYEPHDQSGGVIKYNGFVAQNGSWYIQRLSKGQQRYARGEGDYQDAWANKGKLTYGYINGDK